MFRVTPAAGWFHLISSVRAALGNYVPAPSDDAYYINNLAISSDCRGQDLGQKLLDHVCDEARHQHYRCIELDVTTDNASAIKFYQRYGFYLVSESGTERHETQYHLPKLHRMRLRLKDGFESQFETNSRLINDVTAMNPVEVDEVYVPGTVEQLQQRLQFDNKPISIGGGRFSMGGQTACEKSLHIDMRGLNRVMDIDPERRVIRVQAGACWRQIQSQITDFGLSVKVMQTYADFTVGGSISVNCHGRYIGLGPIILSVNALTLLLHDGSKVEASPDNNLDLFYGTVGGYGAVGIIVEAELSLAENTKIERISQKMARADYGQYFSDQIRNNEKAVFHNADLVPPHFDSLRATTWFVTDKPTNVNDKKSGNSLYLAEKYMLWAITETPFGHFRRKYIYEPLLNMKSKVAMRNDEANYAVSELEPLSRDKKTYVLQEYFIPVRHVESFTDDMAEILKRFDVQVVNVSIRHAHQDPGSYLAWAREEVFALVLYYKQGVSLEDRERVGIWTRELIEAVIQYDGSYYLPYQPHARVDQFHRCYPTAQTLFELKNKWDPDYRFRNCLWGKYYRYQQDAVLFESKDFKSSEFLAVYHQVKSRDDFYLFLQNIYHLYPEQKFHSLIIKTCQRYDNDEAIYNALANTIPEIKTVGSELTYALPALYKQKREMQSQTSAILPQQTQINGYLEIGSTGRYVKSLTKALELTGAVYLTNDTTPDNSAPEIMERAGIAQVGTFFDLDDYAPISTEEIPDKSIDLATCYIGLHHCPRERLAEYIQSIHRVLTPGGHFILRDHDAATDEMKTFCSLVHTAFNAGLGVNWQQNEAELRLFEGIDFWVDQITAQGFSVMESRLLQDNDPSLNTLVCFKKV
jgi:FAD/FMN-containing dehydrogenase/SAM-dependent methyltransferase